MPSHRPSTSTCEQFESAIKPAQQIGRAQRDDAGGGQFDCEGYTIETLTDLHHGPGVAVGQREIGLDPSRPLDEQVDRVGVHKAVDVVTRLARRKRWQRNQLLTVNRHSFSTGGQHHHAGTGLFDAADKAGYRAEHVLTVVQDQQKLFPGKDLDEAVFQ